MVFKAYCDVSLKHTRLFPFDTYFVAFQCIYHKREVWLVRRPLPLIITFYLWKVKSLLNPEHYQTISSLAHYTPFLKISLKSVLNFLWHFANRQFHQIYLEIIPTSASLPWDISSFYKAAHKHIFFFNFLNNKFHPSSHAVFSSLAMLLKTG